MTASDDELAEDEEEILVYVEFEGFGDGDTFSDEHLQLDMIGIDTEHPIMQINGRFYEGTYEDAVGTYMLFATQEKPTLEDPVFDAPATLKYFDKTRKVLKMQRIFTKPRTEVLGDSEDSRCIPNLNTLALAGVPPKYREEALSFWRTMREDRMGALHSYLEKQRIREEKKSKGIELDSESDDDNPFVGYKHKENTDKTDDANVECKTDDPNSSRNIGTSSRVILDKEIPEEKDEADELACAEVEKLAKLAIPESTPSTSKLNTAVDDLQSSKSKSTSMRKKKPGVVHDVRKKTKTKTKTKTKEGKRVISKREKSSSTAANEEKKSAVEEKKETDIIETADKMEVEKIDTTNETELTEEKNDTTNETELTQESDSKITPPDSSPARITKQEKREAKMREISERLKKIAEEYRSTKAD